MFYKSKFVIDYICTMSGDRRHLASLLCILYFALCILCSAFCICVMYFHLVSLICLCSRFYSQDVRRQETVTWLVSFAFCILLCVFCVLHFVFVSCICILYLYLVCVLDSICKMSGDRRHLAGLLHTVK